MKFFALVIVLAMTVAPVFAKDNRKKLSDDDLAAFGDDTDDDTPSSLKGKKHARNPNKGEAPYPEDELNQFAPENFSAEKNSN